VINLQDTRRMVAERVVAGLKEFRALHAPHFRAHHRIIWPPSLRMLPLYMLGAACRVQSLAASSIPGTGLLAKQWAVNSWPVRLQF
jgi:hypothetical protein